MSAAPDDNVERTRNVIDCLGRFDFDGVAARLAADFVQEYPYRPTPESPERIEGRDPFIAFCRGGMAAFDPYSFTVEALHATTDPSIVIAEYSSHTRLLATGAPYANRYVGVFEFDSEGLLVRWREYLNPSIIAAVFGR